MVTTYAHADVDCLPLTVLRAWALRRWPDLEFSIKIDSLGVWIEIEGGSLEVARIEMMLDEISERGYPHGLETQ